MRANDTPMVLHARCVTGVGGGPEKTILNSPRFLARLGYRSVCAFMHPPHDKGFQTIVDRGKTSGAHVISIPDRGPLDWRAIARMRNLCHQLGVTVWHGHDYKTNAIGLLLSRLTPMKTVSTVHGWGHLPTETPLYYGIDKFCLRYLDRVVCVSDDLHRACVDSKVASSRCHVIPNGIDTTDFRRAGTAEVARQEMGRPTQRFVVGCAGRLVDEKRFDYAIHSLMALRKTGVEAELWIAGNGPNQNALAELRDGLNADEFVQLLGHVNDPRRFYQCLDAFALSSEREGLPNVVLEAMAFKVPVVSTRVAGVKALIQHGENGLLVDCGDSATLASSLHTLATDPSLRSRLGEAGRTTVEANYGFDQRMKRMSRLYDELLRRPSRRIEEHV